MSEYLVIRLPADSHSTLSWVVADNSGQRTFVPESGSLDDVSARAQQLPVFVLVPGEDVLLTRVRLPVRGTARMLQAVPFALEEHLADDVNDTHFALGRRDSTGQVAVAATRSELIQGWMHSLQESRIQPTGMYSDAHGIPVHNGYTLVLDAARCLIRDPHGRSIAGSADNAAAMVQAMAASADDLPDDSHLYIPHEQVEAHSQTLSELRMALPDLAIHELAHGTLPLLAATVVNSSGVNLLQGDYAPAGGASESWAAWRNAAVLAGLFVLTALGVKATEVMGLKSELRGLNAQLNEIATEMMPGSRIVDPMVQLEQYAAQLRGSSSASDSQFMSMLETLGGVLGNIDGATIGKLDFRNGTMDLTLTAPDVDTLDRIRQGVEADGLKAEIQSANTIDLGVRGRLRITEKSS